MSKAEIEFAAENAEKLGDLISRSAAKDEILSWAVVINKPHLLSKDDTLHVLDALPAVDAVEVVRCADCRYLKTCNRTIELIPRQAQIGYLRCVVHSCEYGERGADDATD